MEDHEAELGEEKLEEQVEEEFIAIEDHVEELGEIQDHVEELGEMEDHEEESGEVDDHEEEIEKYLEGRSLSKTQNHNKELLQLMSCCDVHFMQEE